MLPRRWKGACEEEPVIFMASARDRETLKGRDTQQHSISCSWNVLSVRLRSRLIKHTFINTKSSVWTVAPLEPPSTAALPPYARGYVRIRCSLPLHALTQTVSNAQTHTWTEENSYVARSVVTLQGTIQAISMDGHTPEQDFSDFQTTSALTSWGMWGPMCGILHQWQLQLAPGLPLLQHLGELSRQERRRMCACEG